MKKKKKIGKKTVFVLSGVTTPSPAIRNIYLLKLQYVTPPTIKEKEEEEEEEDMKHTTSSSLPRKTQFISATATAAATPTPTRKADGRKRNDETDVLDDEIATLKDINLGIYIGYYGFCIGGKSYETRCTNRRRRSAEDLKLELFGVYGPHGDQMNHTLTKEDDPQDILSLGLDIQSTVSPFPLVGSIVFMGLAWALAAYVSITARPAPPIGSDSTLSLDKTMLGLSIVGFLLLLIAVCFLRVAGDMASAILDGAGSGNGFLLNVVGVEALPGYRALRLGTASLVFLGLVVGILAWGLGIGRRGRREQKDEGGEGTGVFGKVVGWGRKKMADGPAWKASIGRPMPVAPLHQAGHAQMAVPQFAGVVGRGLPYVNYI